jgi:hypothetical protein
MHLRITFEKKKRNGLKHHVAACKLLYNVVIIFQTNPTDEIFT